MKSLGKLWAGRVFGTNSGNLFIEFSRTDPDIAGTLRFMDSVLGVAVYSISGSVGDKLTITGTPVKGADGVDLGSLTAEAVLTSDGSLRGTWTSSLGTGGTFEAYPHDVGQSSASNLGGPAVPEQIYTKNVTLGAVRLFPSDVQHLLTYIRQDFLSGRPVVTIRARDSEVTKYAEDFLRDVEQLGRLNYFKVTIQEPEAHGINRLAVVELNAYGANEVRVQGVHESWVIGKAAALASLLKRHESTLVTTYRKFGLNLNQLIFLAMLVAMPSIATWQNRGIFAVAVFLLLAAMLWLHGRFIPNASIQVAGARAGLLARIWPTILSWLAAVSASLVAALVFYWLTRVVA